MKTRYSYEKWINFLSVRLQLDAGYFFRGGFWGTIQQSTGLIIGLSVSYLFGHFTSKQIFGEYNLVLSYFSLLTFFSLPGLDTALVSSIGKKFDGSFVHSVKQKLKFSLLGFPLLIFFAFYSFIRQQQTVAVTLSVTALMYPLLNGFSIYPAFLTGKRKFKELSLLLSVGSLVFLTAHVIGISYFNTTLGLVMAYVLARFTSDLIGFWYARRFLQNKRIDHDVVRYGSFLTLLSVLPWISGHVGSITLATLLGAESLATFAVASRFLTAVQKNFIVFYKPVTAKLAIQSPMQHLQVLKQHSLKLLLMGCALTLILFISTPLLVKFFFTSNYQDAILYGQLMSFALIPLPLSWVLSDMLVYQKKRRTQVIISVVPHLIKISLYLLLIPRFKIFALVFVVLLERYSDPIIPLWSIVRHANKTRT